MPAKYQALRKRLLQERQRVEDLMLAEGQRRSAMTSGADQEGAGNHPGDEGSETFEMEKSLAIQSNLRTLLDEIDHALHKMDAGTYGRCDECGAEIPYERLEVRPSAALCVRCKSSVEHTQLVSSAESRRSLV